ncbi:alpha-ketoglutarate-dependent dioxygenase AlkB [Sphingomonas sp. ID0503]|uniref:alpha-ketoglutarate-dependent dioxygenase AlkB n=1 Tax=Sphingomonas sp. ID0503 TaxID=3399691 RepID=UPI003AFB8096
MTDLFNAPVPPGLSSRNEMISAEEEKVLMAAIDSLDLQPFVFQQWTGKRLTHSFGLNYDLQSGALARAEPIPDWLLDVRERMAAFAGLAADDLVQALLLRYDIGAGIGWHRDRPIYEHVVGLSLGAPATLRFRKRRAERWSRASTPLEPRGAYHLCGEARHNWEHSVVEMDRTRYSIAFRSLSANGRSVVMVLSIYRRSSGGSDCRSGI